MENLPLKKRVNRDKCGFATKQRMFGVFAIDEPRSQASAVYVTLAPSENISSLSYTKRMGLSSSPPRLLLPSSLTPPALSSRCSSPQPLQPSQKEKARPFTAQIEKAWRRKAVVIAISASASAILGQFSHFGAIFGQIIKKCT